MALLMVNLILNLLAVAWAQNPDEITSLPGLNDVFTARQYSGYFSDNRGGQLHYWFVESQNDPVNDPVVLWLNGGPGCSSLYGFFRELGPFKVLPDGKNLELNPWSWNKVANMIFLESPTGVGFSYDPGSNYIHSDDSTSADNLFALDQFFERYPQFQTNSLFLAGESYGGIYIPTLAYRIVQDRVWNFKGYLVGNGLSDYDLNDDSYVQFSYGHGLTDDSVMKKIQTECCPGSIELYCNYSNPISDACNRAVLESNAIVAASGTNVYSLYHPCLPTARLRADFSNLFRKQGYGRKIAEHIIQNYEKAQKSYKGTKSDPPCTPADELDAYLNSQEVKDAIHISPQAIPWTMCSDPVGNNFIRNYNSMKSQYQFILQNFDVRVLVYNGDADMACNYLGDQWFTNSLGQAVTRVRSPWTLNSYTIGFVKDFEKLRFVTVLGTGHMVPEEQPEAAYKMFTTFINNETLT